MSELSLDTCDNEGMGFHVQHDHQRDQWVPLCSPCQQSLPIAPTQAARDWATRRLDLVDVNRTPDAQGYMRGKACVPRAVSECPKCGSSTKESIAVERNNEFILRSYRGAIIRRILDQKCKNCGNIRTWDPYSECILTINDGREGGKHQFVSLHMHIIKMNQSFGQVHEHVPQRNSSTPLTNI
jgi:hypothetical protein